MTIEELLQLRHEISLIQSEFAIAEREAADITTQAEAAVQGRDAALTRLQAARSRLTELIAQRDQIPLVQAEAEAAEREMTALTAQLSPLIQDTINRLREIVAALRSPLWPIPDLDALETQLGGLLANDLTAQLVALPDAINELRSILARPHPFVDTQALSNELAVLEAQGVSLQQQRDDAATRATAARTWLVELIARSSEIAVAEAEVTAAEAAAARVTLRADELLAALNVATVRVQTLRTQLDNLTIQYTQQLDSLVGSLNTDVPLALLPVRLETRFVGTDLLVRIYPDDIHQDTHEPALTKDEVTWGEHFWQQTASASTDRPHRLQAWSQLAGRFGATRAAWIARATQPGVPRPPSREGSWTRAPHTRVLPDRWVAIGYVERQHIFKWGELIPDPLPTGLSPTAQELRPDMVDEGMRWMVDFEEAEKKGMGIRVPLTPEQATKGLDRLVVLGVKATLKPEDSAQRLYDLLEAHHYTWGLGLVPQGTPTNNTPEVKSGYTARDPGYEISFATEREEVLCTPGDNSDGDLAAKTLGFTPPVTPADPRFIFAHVRHAGAQDQIDARHMNTVMWSATLGYFLTQLMEETFTKINLTTGRKYLDWGQYLEWRRYFIDYVRARGPLPALRTANQPYGLLPVSSLEAWNGFNPLWPGTQVGLIDVLRHLRTIWGNALSAVPHLSSNDADPDSRLVQLLGMDAASSSFYARRVLGPRYTDNLWYFLLGNRLDTNWWGLHDLLSTESLNRLGLQPLNPRLAHASFAVEDFEITEPLVQEQPLSETEPLADLVHNDNYIVWLAKATPKEIHDQTFFQNQDTKPKPLLYRLLRHATLQAYADAALQKKPLEPPFIDPELVDVADLIRDDPQASLTLWRHLLSVRTSDTADWIAGLPQPSAGDRELREFRNSLLALSGLPSAALQRLLCESLDLCTYRLDAWITSCVTHRLTALRQSQPTGIHLGGYGWVENLRPRQDALQSTGFVHAPSLAHATTAAVLRSGYLSHQGSSKGDVLAVDLSSRRVKLAKWLIDGVRNGQPLSVLLGYRFERGLHERYVPGTIELDKYVAPFRELAPLVGGKLIPKKNAPATSIAANNVVDGLALHRLWKANRIPFGSQNLPGPGTPEYDAVVAEFKALDDAVDALSDAVIAESVYQVVQGNPLRSGASLDAISRGEALPQELDVVRTPRTGVGITHRVLVMFSGDTDPNDAATQQWAQQVRAKAEPHVNTWAARLLGDPKNVLCQVRYQYPDPNLPHSVRQDTRTLSLKELNLCPLDIVYASLVTEQAQRSDLEQWLIYHALKTRKSPTDQPPLPSDVPASADVQLIFTRDPNWEVEKVSFPELLEIARAIRELVTGARAIDARDVSQPGQGVLPGIGPKQLEELKGRANAAENALRDVVSELEPFLATNNPDLDQLRTVLLKFAYFGMQGAVPLSPAGDTPEDRVTLLAQARSLADNVAQRLKRIDAITSVTADDYLARLREVFGPSFRILPQFNLSSTTLKDAFDLRATVKDAGPKQVIPWFQRIARIRAGAARLDTALMYAEAIGAGDGLSFQVAQLPLPTQGKDGWVGLDVQSMPDGRMLGGRLSLVAHTPAKFDATQPLAGLLIDEWVEVVPNPSETTAVTFHYDAPGACAPQAILLAVIPDPNKPWDLDTLEAVILETLELAKLRAIDPDLLGKLGELGHYLPALYFAYNQGGDPNGDTIATDFKS